MDLYRITEQHSLFATSLEPVIGVVNTDEPMHFQGEQLQGTVVQNRVHLVGGTVLHEGRIALVMLQISADPARVTKVQ